MADNSIQMKFVYNKENVAALERFVVKKLQKVGIRRNERFNFIFILLNLLKIWSEYVSPRKISAPEVAISLFADRSIARLSITFDPIIPKGMIEYFSELVNNKIKRKLPVQRDWEINKSLSTSFYRWEMLKFLSGKLSYMKEDYSERIILEYNFSQAQRAVV